VRGPRQIGKTTAQLQVLGDLLESGVPGHAILRLQADELEQGVVQEAQVLSNAFAADVRFERPLRLARERFFRRISSGSIKA
jgi:hypothetical protein